MARNRNYGAARLKKQRRIGIALQRLHLEQACPNGHGHFTKSRCLKWTYETKPTPLSRIYSIRIEYCLDAPPKIFVVVPRLCDLSNGRKIPHLYSQTKQLLCLYKPGKGEWSPEMMLDKTVLPWVELWLFYFEEWLVSGEWKGGGEHPVKNEAR